MSSTSSTNLQHGKSSMARNLHLHVVDDSAWPFAEDQRYVEGWAAWLDLADGGDRAADRLLDRLMGGRLIA